MSGRLFFCSSCRSIELGGCGDVASVEGVYPELPAGSPLARSIEEAFMSLPLLGL